MGKPSIPRLALAMTVFAIFLFPPTESFAKKTWLEKLFSGPQEVTPKRRKPRPAAKAVKPATKVVTPLTAPVPAAKPDTAGPDQSRPPQSLESIPTAEDSPPSSEPAGPLQSAPPPQPRPTPPSDGVPDNAGEAPPKNADAVPPRNEAPLETVPVPEPNPRTATEKPDAAEPADASPEPILPDPRSGDRPDPSGQLPADEIACRQRLNELGVKFENKPAQTDPEGCSMPYPIAIKSLGSQIGLSPEAEMNCAMAEAAARFAEDVISTAAKAVFGESLKSISHASAYVCRPRNGTNKLSEHAFGNALDIASFTLSDGTTIVVEPTPPEKNGAFLDRVRGAACGPFKTVLGPGAADHSEHLHFDLAPRRHGGTVCE